MCINVLRGRGNMKPREGQMRNGLVAFDQVETGQNTCIFCFATLSFFNYCSREEMV